MLGFLDRFRTERAVDPGRGAIAVTPSDSADLSGVAKALYIGVAGDVVVTTADMADGTSIKFVACGNGFLPMQVKRVWATGTTATSIVAV